MDHRRQQKNQQEVYQEILFSQWLNDELDEPSEEELLEKLGKRQRRVLLAQVPRQAETTISQWLTKRKEPFITNEIMENLFYLFCCFRRRQ